MNLRLLPEDELAGDPARCIEVLFTAVPVEDDRLVLRITPADLVRLRMETELVLGEIRAEVMRAKIAWKQQLGQWYEEGRAAVEAREPDVALLARVLQGLRGRTLVPV